MFDKIKNLFSDKVVPKTPSKTTVIETNVRKTAWRNNMWVMTSSGVGILFAMGEPCTVHIVDKITGETVKEIYASSDTIRQAKYLEIPECRRGDKEKAAKLGYV
jgi:hypothetical protein